MKKKYIIPTFSIIEFESECLTPISNTRLRSGASDYNPGENNIPGVGGSVNNSNDFAKGFSWDTWGDDEDF